ncbi:hypothetical protein [Bernardetia sp.]|uniref:hypothetical protein n=1 Tax=Bernardetia sp. TaxID=1937974 RepID=UPI0025BC91A1|nr:hypothetical protein [Bernardetia sp.]
MQELEYPIYVFNRPVKTPISKYNLALELEKLRETMDNLSFKKEEKEIICCILGTYFNELEGVAKELEYQLIKQTDISAVFYIWCDTKNSQALVEAVEHCNPMYLKGGIDALLELFTDAFDGAKHPFHTLPIANIVKQTLSPIEIKQGEADGKTGMTKFIHKITLGV